jgi:hypothetical protein
VPSKDIAPIHSTVIVVGGVGGVLVLANSTGIKSTGIPCSGFVGSFVFVSRCLTRARYALGHSRTTAGSTCDRFRWPKATVGAFNGGKSKLLFFTTQ